MLDAVYRDTDQGVDGEYTSWSALDLFQGTSLSEHQICRVMNDPYRQANLDIL